MSPGFRRRYQLTHTLFHNTTHTLPVWSHTWITAWTHAAKQVRVGRGDPSQVSAASAHTQSTHLVRTVAVLLSSPKVHQVGLVEDAHDQLVADGSSDDAACQLEGLVQVGHCDSRAPPCGEKHLINISF